MIAMRNASPIPSQAPERRPLAAASILSILIVLAVAATARAQSAPSPAFQVSRPAESTPSTGAGSAPTTAATPTPTPAKSLQQKWAEKTATASSASPQAPAAPAATRPTPSPAPTAAAPSPAPATAAPSPTAPAAPGGAVHLTGTFNWVGERGGKIMHPLTATLTPTAPGRWDAVWNFSWSNQPQVFRGAVQGNLQDGAVSGTGNMAGGRTFAFTGTARAGAWTISTTETTGGKSVVTGIGTAQVGR